MTAVPRQGAAPAAPVSTPATTTFKSLETLRIAAAVAVVLAHSSQFAIPYLQPFLGGTVFLGAIGVDIFFVVSGFVMACAALKSPPGPAAAGTFMASRLLRLFPLYACITLLAVGYLLAKGRPVDPWHVFTSLFFLPTTGPAGVEDPIVAMGWTLRFEMYFYLLVAAGIAVNRKIAVPVLAVLASVGAWMAYGFYFGAPLVLEFIAGFMLGMFRQPLLDAIRARAGRTVFLAGLVAACAVVLAASTGHDFGADNHGMYSAVPRLWIVYAGAELPRVVVWGVPAVLLVYACLGLERDLAWRLAPLGKFTFSVYMLQFFALLIAGRLNKLPWMPDLLAFAIGAILLGAGSVATYHWIEMPAIKLRHRLGRRRATTLPVRTLEAGRR
jgi:exopolysaccharide production protein ExoZ